MVGLIECCVRSVGDGPRRRLREGDDTVRVRPCLEHSGKCRDRPFLVEDCEPVIGRYLPEGEDAGEHGSTSYPHRFTRMPNERPLRLHR